MSSVKDIYALDAEYYSAYRYEEEVKRVENNRFVTKILFFTLLMVSLFLVYKYFVNHYEALSKYISVPSFLTVQEENIILSDESKIVEKIIKPTVIIPKAIVEEKAIAVPYVELSKAVEVKETVIVEKKPVAIVPSTPAASKSLFIPSDSIESKDLSPEYIELIQKSLGK